MLHILYVVPSITGANYCPDAYYLNYACCPALVNNNLLTQRSSCIGRLQVEAWEFISYKR